MNLQEFAKAVLEAQRIREESFDCNAASKEGVKSMRLGVQPRSFYEKFYGLTLYESVDEAVTNAGFGLQELQLVFILLSHSWDDVKLWAETALRDGIPDEAA